MTELEALRKVTEGIKEWVQKNFTPKATTFEARWEGMTGSEKVGTYTYEDGMTWAEFVESDFNSDGKFSCSEDAVFLSNGYYEVQVYGSNEVDTEATEGYDYMQNTIAVKPTDKIQYKYYGVSD